MVNESEVTNVCNTIDGNCLLEVFFEKCKLLWSYSSEFTILAEEASRQFSGFTGIVTFMRTLMYSYTPEDTEIVILSIKRYNFSFVSKPSRKAPNSDLQRLPIYNDFEINKQVSLESPFRIGSL